MGKTTIPVKGMSCEGCESAVVNAVKRIDGVLSATANRHDQQVEVDYVGKVEDAVIRQAVEDAGYKAG